MSDTTIGSLDIVLSGDDASFLAMMSRAEARMQKLTGTTRQFGPAASNSFKQAEAASTRFGHSSVSSVQAASGALRELNGNFTNNIRAVERFITMIPGVGNALKMAFPLVGGLAFGAVVFEAGQKLRQFIKETEEIPKHITDGFNELHSAAQLAADSLDITNDKLAIQIAKLEHKPVNALKLTLDEARQSADKLGSSLAAADTKATELIEKNKVGFWGKVTGQAGTEDSTKLVADIQGQIEKVRAEYQSTIDDAVDIGGASAKNIADIKTAEMVRLEGIYQKAHDRIKPILKSLLDDQYDFKRYGVSGSNKNQDANIAILSGFNRELSDQEKSVGGQYGEDTQTAKLNDLNANKSNGDESRKAAEAQMRGMEQANAALKLQNDNDHNAMIVAELAFWESMLAPAKKYPENLAKVQNEVAGLTQQYFAALDRMAKQSVEEQTKAQKEQAEAFRTLERVLDEDQRATHRAADASAQLTATYQRNADAIAEMSLTHDVATGKVDRYAESLEMARLHAEAYQAQLKALRQEQANDDADASLGAEERGARKSQIDVKISTVTGEMNRTAQQDAWNTQNATALGGATQALQEFIRAANDTSGIMKSTVSTALNDFNHTLLDVITTNRNGHRGAWTGLGHSLATNAASTSLKWGEGKIAGAFGLGQMGTRANPMFTKSADLVALNADKVAGFSDTNGLFGAMKSIPSPTSSGGGGFLSGLLKTVIPFIPGFADGTTGFGGGLALVGERGPELVNLPGGSTVTPNGKMPSFGGGPLSIHVDARGTSDPAAVEAAGYRGGLRALQEHGKTLVGGTARAIQGDRDRTPPTRRR
jgi:hypothetical protein